MQIKKILASGHSLKEVSGSLRPMESILRTPEYSAEFTNKYRIYSEQLLGGRLKSCFKGTAHTAWMGLLSVHFQKSASIFTTGDDRRWTP
jgi:hypothetical protein